MKLTMLVTIHFLFLNIAVSQLTKLDQFENKMSRKIEIGMSTNEVKTKIGKPQSIEGGYPDVNNRILFEQPKQIGQLNNSTWFYAFDKIHITYDYPGGITYYVNGFVVPENIYKQYRDRLEVYMLNGEIIDTSMAQSYISLKNPNIKIVNRDYRTEIKNEEPGKITEIVKPIFCVIFDKGTQVVAAKKMYFLRLDIK